MGNSNLARSRWTRGALSLHAVILAALGAASVCAQAEPLKLYLYKEKGHAVYATQKPAGVPYTEVFPGSGAARPILSEPPPQAAAEAELATAMETDKPALDIAPALVGWAASCKGVNREMMDQRAAPWRAVVDKHAKAHDVPVALVHALIRVESCFDTRAESRVGARGLMQLMPQTAAQLGVRDSFDAEQNIAGGVRYLSQLLKRFRNDTRLAVAAYNAGPNAVDAYDGIPPFSETRLYVERVLTEYRGHKLAAKNTKKKSKG